MTEEQIDNFFMQISQQIILSMQTNPNAWLKLFTSMVVFMGIAVALWAWARHKFNNP